MTFNLSGLINNVQGSLSNFFGDEAKKTSESSFYPPLPTVQTTINPANWATLPFPYSFAVYNGVTKSFDGTPFGEFQLPLAPQRLNQSEKFAINITQTQGGTVVEHSGAKYKTLSISGTTGLAPFRGAGGVKKSTGEAIFQPDQLKFQSGYKVFHLLRNYFNTYYQYKMEHSNDPEVREYRLVFKNYKDGQFLIVELSAPFKLQRDAQQRFLYNYEIECEVLKQIDYAEDTNELSTLELLESRLNSALEKIDTARGVFLRAQDILRQVESTYDSAILEPLRKVSLATKAFLGVVTTAADMGNRIIKKTINKVNAIAILTGLKDEQDEYRRSGGGSSIIGKAKLPDDILTAVRVSGASVITDLNEVLFEVSSTTLPESAQDALAQDQLDARNLPRQFYEETITDLRRIKEDVEDSFNLGSSSYDELFGRTSTIVATDDLISNDEIDILNAFNDSISGIRLIISTMNLFKSSYNDRLQNFVDKFDDELAVRFQPAMRQLILSAGTTLEDIAATYLGDYNRWIELVELNNLKPPYITQDITSTLEAVLRPGDIILIPQPLINGFSEVPDSSKNPLTTNLTLLEKSLGVDLKLNKDFDLSLGNNGDLQTIVGIDNLLQAIQLKFRYNRGEVRSSSRIGVGLNIGSKTKDVFELKDSIIQTALQDPRIAKITDLAIFKEGPATTIGFNLNVKNIDLPIPQEIKLNG